VRKDEQFAEKGVQVSVEHIKWLAGTIARTTIPFISRFASGRGRGQKIKREIIAAMTAVAMAGFIGCGGSDTSPGIPQPLNANPFNTAAGEGNLVGSQLTIAYPTNPQPGSGFVGLQTSFEESICRGLTAAQCAANENSLNTPALGSFDLTLNPISNNPLGISSVDAVRIGYTAINVDGNAVTASGGALVPEIATSQIKGMVLYFHGTTADRNNVPSNFPAKDTPGGSGDDESLTLAAMLASQGYVVVMPDFLGLGVDTIEPTPFTIYPAINAQSGLSMLLAVRKSLANNYSVPQSQLLKLYITGYSEGAAYALQTVNMMQQKPGYATTLNVSLREAAPLSGAYDLANTETDYLFANVMLGDQWHSLDARLSAQSKPYLLDFVVLVEAFYTKTSATLIFQASNYNCVASICADGLTLHDVYFNEGLTDFDIEAIALGLALNSGYRLSNNTVAPLFQPSVATALETHDTTNALYQAIATADTYKFTPSIPLTLIALAFDSVVTNVNSTVAFHYFVSQNASGPYRLDLINNALFLADSSSGVGFVDHQTELPFLSPLLLSEFNSHG
jgi:hypothetical protein